jgi:hypothetical protein
MRTLFSVAVGFCFLAGVSQAQLKLQEGFETSDSTHFPLGWTHWNEAGEILGDSAALWTVQDTGLAMPGINTRLTVAHSGSKSVRATWWAYGAGNLIDDWLITRRINNISIDDTLRFWATGANGPNTPFYPDTLEIWLGDQDSLPSSQTLLLDVITWQNGSLYGVFRKYTYPLGVAAGLNIFVSFRYHIIVDVDGYAVQVDDIQVAGPLTDVQPPRGLPEEVLLSQNYPNPFNPSTTIQWTVPAKSMVTLKIFNLIGQEVGTLVESDMEAGEYRTTWDARGFTTGAYFYRLQVGNTVQTRKLVLVK